MKFNLSRVMIIAALTAQYSCKPVSTQSAQETSCPLNPGDYGVQSALYQADKGHYELMVLNAPACFHQPLILKNLQLARLDEKEKTEKAKLQFSGEDNSVLYMVEDYPIKMVQTVTENGVKREQSGSWSPFLTGLAGGAVGAVAGSMLSRAFQKPQHYTPPPMEAGNTQLRGYGGAGATREGAVRSYEQKYASRPQALSQPTTQPAPSTSEGSKKSFFRTKSQSSTGAVRSYQPAPSSSPKRGFFKSRRR